MAGVSRRMEEMQERVQESTKVLEQELVLFKHVKEQEMRNIMSEFVKI